MEGRGCWTFGTNSLVAAIFLLEFLALFDGRMLDNGDSSKICICNLDASGKFWKLNKRFIVDEFFSENMTIECHQIYCNCKIDAFNFRLEISIEEFLNDGIFLEDFLPKLPIENYTMRNESNKTTTNIDTVNSIDNDTILMTSTTEMINTTTLPDIPNAVVFYSTKYKMIPLIDNKLNATDSGQKFTISPNGLEAKFFGSSGTSCVRAVLPISPFNLTTDKPMIAYYEVQILNTGGDIAIGFCEKESPLDGSRLGLHAKNSIGLLGKGEMWINFEGERYKDRLDLSERNFEKYEVVGIGIIYKANSTIKTFAAVDGKLLGKPELPPIFTTFQLYPVICLHYGLDKVYVNFGKNYWTFWEFDQPALLWSYENE